MPIHLQRIPVLRSFFRHLRGVLVFSAITVNTIFWFVPLFLFSIVKLVVPVASFRQRLSRILMWIGEYWIDGNAVIISAACDKRIEIRGLDGLRRDGWYLIASNHQTWVDVIVLQTVFNRRIPFLKFFIKQQLIWFPFLGIAWWALDMPFMKRHSTSYLARHPEMRGKDLETTRNACRKFRSTPTSVINFLEGTRFSADKRESRKSPYTRLLPPRAGGFAVAVGSMGELFDAMLDVTLVYRDGVPQFWQMCCGHPVHVVVDIRQRPIEPWLIEGDYERDREFRRRVHVWLGGIWQEKDELIQRMDAEVNV